MSDEDRTMYTLEPELARVQFSTPPRPIFEQAGLPSPFVAPSIVNEPSVTTANVTAGTGKLFFYPCPYCAGCAAACKGHEYDLSRGWRPPAAPCADCGSCPTCGRK